LKVDFCFQLSEFQLLFSSGHDGAGCGPIARAGAAADGPRPHEIARARDQAGQHNPLRFCGKVRLLPGFAAIHAGLHLINLGVNHRLQPQQHLGGAVVEQAEDPALKRRAIVGLSLWDGDGFGFGRMVAARKDLLSLAGLWTLAGIESQP